MYVHTCIHMCIHIYIYIHIHIYVQPRRLKRKWQIRSFENAFGRSEHRQLRRRLTNRPVCNGSLR